MGSPPIQAPLLKHKETEIYSKTYQTNKNRTPPERYVLPLAPLPPRPPIKKAKPKVEVKIQSSGLKEKIPEQDIGNLKKAIRVMNDITGSPLIIIIGVLILASSIPVAISDMQSNLYIGIMKIVVNSYRFIMILVLFNLNQRIVITPIRNESYTSLGIDALLLGFIGLPLYGLGTFMLFEGIFILMYEIFIRHNNLIELGKKDALSKEIFSANFMESSIKVMNEFLVKGTTFLMFLSVLPILKTIKDFSTVLIAETIGTLVFYAIFFTVGFAFVLYLKTTYVPIVKNRAYQDISEDIIVKCIVFSAFSLIYAGIGVLGLIICILLFAYRGLYKSIKRKLPSIQYIKPTIKQETEYSPSPEVPKEKTKPFVPSTIESKDPSPKSIPPLPSSEKKPLQEIPVMRMDDKEARKQLIDSLQQSETQQLDKHLGKPPVGTKGDIKEYIDRVFTVLTADIRERLLKLEIQEDQKWDVVREFVNLKKEQQQKYLEELENINRVLSEELIKRVKKMKLPQKETDSIIKQLEIMDPKEQTQFVEFLEQTH